ncbi:MAG: hypothetical protein ABID54_04235 [Pseudomonadota bacterium]
MNITELKDYQGDDRVISSHDMEERIRNQKTLFSVRSMIPLLDRYTEGFEAGELVIVSGITKNGKTTMAQTLTNNFYKQGYFSLWFTYELPPRQFLRCFPELPLLYMPSILKSGSWKWLETRILESFVKYNTRIIFIDHLHYIVDMLRQGNASLEIGTIIRQLKLMAVRHNFIIFLMAHTRKKSDGDSFGDPRDASFIEQESDVTLMVKRFPDIEENLACVRVNQHRRTGVMMKKVWLQKIDGYLVETTEREEPKSKRSYYDKD